MLINLIRACVIIAGPTIGYIQISRDWKGIIIGTAVAIFIIAIEIIIDRVALDALILGAIGAVFGVIAANLLKWAVYHMGSPQLYSFAEQYALLMNIVFAYTGLVIGVKKRAELDSLDRDLISKGSKRKSSIIHVIDTSVLIDGRIVDICESKFLAGSLIVPKFVLNELQHIADSADGARRSRGRRGMETVSRLQENTDIPVKIFEKDYANVKEVDSKLIVMARDLNAKIITTDFNLNKVASLQGITVLNINDLANSLKPVVLPGENMDVFVVKDGKEKDQGVAYLDDGTMVVVEGGRRAMGQKVTATVTSILQTSAGRMIFTKAQKIQDSQGDEPEPSAHSGH